MGTILIRALILYFVVIFAVRLMGKRQLGELQPSELVITILISNIATLPLEDPSIPLLPGILPILSMVCFEVITSWFTLKSRRLRQIICGSPKIIIRNGQLEQDTLRELRFSLDDLMTALRGNQVFSLEEIQFAIVETTGSVSVYLKKEHQPLTLQDVDLHPKTIDPPVTLISDGKISRTALHSLQKETSWLTAELQRRQLQAKNIFLLTADQNGICTCIPKKNKKEQPIHDTI
ncbi:MAG: DUF421 domain-containing protein [Oscillospiraceae bacterium]|nr:DUF421 domain-containing protein [Oscillospiraceae bacterium]